MIVLIGAVAWTATLHCLSFFFGWGLRFEFNHLDECAYETADVGAFYTCGQQATCLVNPGNILRSSTFTNIHNLGPLGVQQNEVDAVYLDDMMSSWTITNNTFINCSSGVGAAVFVGGGRLNAITGNHFESCPTAIHFDSRGTGHHKGPGGPPKYVLSRSSPLASQTGLRLQHGAETVIFYVQGWSLSFQTTAATCLPELSSPVPRCPSQVPVYWTRAQRHLHPAAWRLRLPDRRT